MAKLGIGYFAFIIFFFIIISLLAFGSLSAPTLEAIEGNNGSLKKTDTTQKQSLPMKIRSTIMPRQLLRNPPFPCQPGICQSVHLPDFCPDEECQCHSTYYPYCLDRNFDFSPYLTPCEPGNCKADDAENNNASCPDEECHCRPYFKYCVERNLIFPGYPFPCRPGNCNSDPKILNNTCPDDNCHCVPYSGQCMDIEFNRVDKFDTEPTRLIYT